MLRTKRNDTFNLGFNLRLEEGWHEPVNPPLGRSICEVVGISCRETKDSTDDEGSIILYNHVLRNVHRIWVRHDRDAKRWWLFDDGCSHIFGRRLTNDEMQGENGYMPASTVREALGAFVAIDAVENGDWVNWKIVDGPFGPPDGVRAMYESGLATGSLPTTAAELFAATQQFDDDF